MMPSVVSTGARDRFHVKPQGGSMGRCRGTGVFHVERWVMFSVLVAVLLPGCEGSRRSGSFWRGERDVSASVRTAKARPTPADEGHHPLEGDRFAIDEEMERRQSEHQSEHGEGSLRLEGFSHPACAGIEASHKRRCPLLAMRWGRARDCAGGVELELKDANVEVVELRREMLCHIAFGRVATETHCPLHVEGVRVESERRGTTWVFRLTASKAVDELRARVRRLLR